MQVCQSSDTVLLVPLILLSVLTALPALAMAPQPIQAKVAVAATAPSPPATLVTGLEVSPVGVAGPGMSDGQKNTWVYLEELANTLLNNVHQLKALIEQAKNSAAEADGAKGGRKEVKPRSQTEVRIIRNKKKKECDL